MFILSHDNNTAVNSELVRSFKIVQDPKQYGAEYALLVNIPFTFERKNTTVCIDVSDNLSNLREHLASIVDMINKRK